MNIEFGKDFKLIQKVIIRHPRSERLFVALKRSEDDKVRPGDWDLPGGGVDYGELHEDALLREVDEETGLQIGGVRVVDVISAFDPEEGIMIVRIIYVTTAQTVTVTVSGEHSAYEWMDAGEFSEKCDSEAYAGAAMRFYAEE